jgi:hypothetical protein
MCIFKRFLGLKISSMCTTIIIILLMLAFNLSQINMFTLWQRWSNQIGIVAPIMIILSFFFTLETCFNLIFNITKPPINFMLLTSLPQRLQTSKLFISIINCSTTISCCCCCLVVLKVFWFNQISFSLNWLTPILMWICLVWIVVCLLIGVGVVADWV